MINNCNNCDHKNVCVNCDFTSNNFECPYWNGWHDAKEEPPEKDKNVELFIDGESVGFGWLHNDRYYALWGALSSLTAIRKERVTHWRNLMEYEV